MSPNSELYFRNHYQPDFSRAAPWLQRLFIHEMSHVWQKQRGMWVRTRGLASWLVSYRYTLDGRLLSSYPMEQQAQIIADHFLLQKHGYETWESSRNRDEVTFDGDINEETIRQRYRQVLGNFPWSKL